MNEAVEGPLPVVPPPVVPPPPPVPVVPAPPEAPDAGPPPAVFGLLPLLDVSWLPQPIGDIKDRLARSRRTRGADRYSFMATAQVERLKHCCLPLGNFEPATQAQVVPEVSPSLTIKELGKSGSGRKVRPQFQRA